VIRRLPRILRLRSAELLVLATRHCQPDERFSMPELSRRSGVRVQRLLSRNRTLSHSLGTRGLQKSWVLQEHGGSPRQFSVPADVHAEIARLLTQQDADQPAAVGNNEADGE
jgi:hypothetical protein